MFQVYVLPATRGLRVRHANHFLALLQRKALALLKYIGAESYVFYFTFVYLLTVPYLIVVNCSNFGTTDSKP